MHPACNIVKKLITNSNLIVYPSCFLLTLTALPELTSPALLASSNLYANNFYIPKLQSQSFSHTSHKYLSINSCSLEFTGELYFSNFIGIAVTTVLAVSSVPNEPQTCYFPATSCLFIPLSMPPGYPEVTLFSDSFNSFLFLCPNICLLSKTQAHQGHVPYPPLSHSSFCCCLYFRLILPCISISNSYRNLHISSG